MLCLLYSAMQDGDEEEEEEEVGLIVILLSIMSCLNVYLISCLSVILLLLTID